MVHFLEPSVCFGGGYVWAIILLVQYSSICCIPFDVIKEVFSDFVYVENFISGEVEVEATP